MFGVMRGNGHEEKQKLFPFFFKSALIFRRQFFLKKTGIFCMFHMRIVFSLRTGTTDIAPVLCGE